MRVFSVKDFQQSSWLGSEMLWKQYFLNLISYCASSMFYKLFGVGFGTTDMELRTKIVNRSCCFFVMFYMLRVKWTAIYLEELCNDSVAQKYPNFLSYFNEIWERKFEWCHYYRINLQIYERYSWIRIFKYLVLRDVRLLTRSPYWTLLLLL